MGNTAEDVNTIFSRTDCFVNVAECELVLLIENIRKQLELRKNWLPESYKKRKRRFVSGELPEAFSCTCVDSASAAIAGLLAHLTAFASCVVNRILTATAITKPNAATNAKTTITVFH